MSDQSFELTTLRAEYEEARAEIIRQRARIEELERSASLVAAQAAAEEREACAKVCESFKQGNSATYIDDDWADMCAEAIRERKSP